MKTDAHYEKYGDTVFTMFTQNGYPPEIAIDDIDKELELSISAKIVILQRFQYLIMQHCRKSKITEENREKLQEKNKRDIMQLYRTGDFDGM